MIILKLIEEIIINTVKGFFIFLSYMIPVVIGAIVCSTTTLNTLTDNIGHDFLGFGFLDLICILGTLGPYTTAWYFYGRPNGDKWTSFMN